MPDLAPADGPLRRTLYRIVFLSDTPASRGFDVALIVAIVASIAVVMVESVPTIEAQYSRLLVGAEWAFTLLFTVEYAVRLAVVRRPRRYAASFFGVVDLLSILPTFVSLVVPGAQALLTVRILRVLRVFRVLKLSHYVSEAEALGGALAASKRKIFVFIFTVLTIVTVLGAMMYLVEGGQNGFTSIPLSVYWAVVTLTTVGFGDIAPVTPLGRAITVVIVILGYGIIAVPTGIVTVELNRASARFARMCPACGLARHDDDARFCKLCGDRLVIPTAPTIPAPVPPQGC